MPFKVTGETNFTRVFRAMDKFTSSAKMLSKKDFMAQMFFEAYEGRYRLEAMNIVFEQVYQKYTPKTNKRKFNLLRAPKMVLEGNRVTLMLDLNESLKAYGEGEHEYYPLYVAKGIYPKHMGKIPKRDWYHGSKGWVKFFGRKYAKDFRKLIIARLKG